MHSKELSIREEAPRTSELGGRVATLQDAVAELLGHLLINRRRIETLGSAERVILDSNGKPRPDAVAQVQQQYAARYPHMPVSDWTAWPNRLTPHPAGV